MPIPTPRQREFYIVDMHHHMGKEENIKNLQPASPDGSYNFFRFVLHGTAFKNGVLKELAENGDAYRYFMPEDRESVLSYHRYLGPLTELSTRIGGPNLVRQFEDTTIIDQTVVFPMHDIYRERAIPAYKDRDVGTPQYSYSNSRISQIVHRYPNTLRLIGFGRINPTNDHALDEVDRLVTTCGLRGIKVHPKSDGWPINDESLKAFFVRTAHHRVPVIFHTSFLTEVEKIHDVATSALDALIAQHFERYTPDRPALPVLRRTIEGLRVIIGHCGWHTSTELFQYLSHPNVYGEIAGIKGENVDRFCQVAARDFSMRYFMTERVPALAERWSLPEPLVTELYAPYLGQRWSNKVMFGTDYPFLDQNQAIDVLLTLFRREFVGTTLDIQNFLGLTALRIIPPMYASPYIRSRLVPPPPKWTLTDPHSEAFNTGFFGGLLGQAKARTIAGVYPDLLLDTAPFERVRTGEAVYTIVTRGKDQRAAALLISGLFERFEQDAVPDRAVVAEAATAASALGRPATPKRWMHVRLLDPSELPALADRVPGPVLGTDGPFGAEFDLESEGAEYDRQFETLISKLKASPTGRQTGEA